MKVKEEVIAEDNEKVVKLVTYERTGTALKIHNTDEIIRELAYIFRHTNFPIKELHVISGKDITYTQTVVERKDNGGKRNP